LHPRVFQDRIADTPLPQAIPSAGPSPVTALYLLHALDVVDAGDAAQLVDQAVEMAEVDGLDDEVHHRAAVAGAVNQTILRVLWNSSLVP